MTILGEAGNDTTFTYTNTPGEMMFQMIYLDRAYTITNFRFWVKDWSTPTPACACRYEVRPAILSGGLYSIDYPTAPQYAGGSFNVNSMTTAIGTYVQFLQYPGLTLQPGPWWFNVGLRLATENYYDPIFTVPASDWSWGGTKGSFPLNRFMYYKNGIGVAQSNKALYLQLVGTYASSTSLGTINETDVIIKTTVRDET